MSLVQRLLEQLKQRGLSIKHGDQPEQLLLCGPTIEKTPEILRAVKALKPQLLEQFHQNGKEPETAPESERRHDVHNA